MTMLHGIIFNIQRFSLHDGPGIRTTVFLKGCPLSCLWCHNPEGLLAQTELRLAHALCTRCGRCQQLCPATVHQLTAEVHLLTPEQCRHCGQCVANCPAMALELVGEEKTVEEVMAVVRRDIPFYQTSGGGMTLSGGEPLQQAEFSLALLQTARNEDIATAIETSALAPWKILQRCRPLTDLFLVDLKHTDPIRHRELTGVSNTLIMQNLQRMITEGWPLILRIPWIPHYNAEPTFLEGLVTWLATFPTPPPVEFMPYHRLGQGKWKALGKTSPLPDTIAEATSTDLQPWAIRLREVGVQVLGLRDEGVRS